MSNSAPHPRPHRCHLGQLYLRAAGQRDISRDFPGFIPGPNYLAVPPGRPSSQAHGAIREFEMFTLSVVDPIEAALGMARRSFSTSPTVKTVIGFLSGGEEVALEMVGHDLFVTIDGERIARRERGGARTKAVKSWIPLKRGWTVTDTTSPLELEIEHDGVRLEWAPRIEQS